MLLIALSALFGSAFFWNQSRYCYRPGSEETLVSKLHSHSDLSPQEVTFDSLDGTQLHGFWIPAPASASPTHATLLYSHGNKGTVYDFFRLARQLRNHLNCNVFMYDYRGFGHSKGAAYEQGVKMDAEAAFTHAFNRPETDRNNFILYGQSLGGGVSFYLANKFASQVRILVVENSFHSFQRVIPTAVPRALAFFKYFCFERWESYLELQAMVHKPSHPDILLLSGTKDTMIYPEHLADLHKIAHERSKITGFRVRLERFPDGEHNNTHLQPGYFQAIKSFVTGP